MNSCESIFLFASLFVKKCIYANSLFPFSMLRCLSSMLRHVCSQSSNTCICGFVLVCNNVILKRASDFDSMAHLREKSAANQLTFGQAKLSG